MTGTDRLFNSTETSLRAPYAAPRNVPHRDAGFREPAGRDASSFARAEGSVLTPFVPREFRDVARESGAREQGAHELQVREQNASEQEPREFALGNVTDAPSLEQNFAAISDDEVSGETPGFADIESVDDAAPMMGDLPWIDTFVADEADVAPDADDEWPMGEAGKRLNELTQSLTSLDASRARQEAEGNAELRASESSDAEHAMWNEEEWIDIMPTPLASSASAELSHMISRPQVASESITEAVSESAPQSVDAGSSASPIGGISEAEAQEQVRASSSARVVSAENAARALEGLAMRVRSGDVQLPAFKSDVAEEAMLAGVLASMLGWRQ